MNELISHHLAANDVILAEIIDTISLPEIDRTGDVFHDLMSCIIEQQIHYRSTKKTFQKLLAAADIDRLTVANFSILEEQAFPKVKLSTQKYETMVRILAFFQANDLDWEAMEDREVRTQLSSIKGVGPWTIEMILLYTLGRPDIFPADDYHLKQFLVGLYEVDTSSRVKAKLKAIGARWSPYQSTGVRYILAWKAFLKNK